MEAGRLGGIATWNKWRNVEEDNRRLKEENKRLMEERVMIGEITKEITNSIFEINLDE